MNHQTRFKLGVNLFAFGAQSISMHLRQKSIQTEMHTRALLIDAHLEVDHTCPSNDLKHFSLDSQPEGD